MDIGKLYSGAPGEIYFAFTSLKDPKFRKYDRFGYAGYEAEVSANALIPDINHDNSQVQLGVRVSGMAGPGEMFSFGSMYSVGSGAPQIHGERRPWRWRTSRRFRCAWRHRKRNTCRRGGLVRHGERRQQRQRSDHKCNGSADGSDLSGSLSANSNNGNASSISSSRQHAGLQRAARRGGTGRRLRRARNFWSRSFSWLRRIRRRI